MVRFHGQKQIPTSRTLVSCYCWITRNVNTDVIGKGVYSINNSTDLDAAVAAAALIRNSVEGWTAPKKCYPI